MHHGNQGMLGNLVILIFKTIQSGNYMYGQHLGEIMKNEDIFSISLDRHNHI